MMIWCVRSTKECVTTDVSQFLICPCTFLRFQGLYNIVSSHFRYRRPRSMRRVYKNLCPATINASIMAANMWQNNLKNVESDNNKILYETLLDFLQRNGTYFLNKFRILTDGTLHDIFHSAQVILRWSICSKIYEDIFFFCFCFVTFPFFPQLGAFATLRRATINSSCLSVCPSPWNSSAPTGRILLKSWYLVVFRKSVEKIQVPLKSHKNNEHFTWRTTWIYISRNSP